MPFLIVFLVIVVLCLILVNVRIVNQAHCFVIERFGVYAKTWQAGFHVKVPFIERVATKISLKEQVLDFPPQDVITKDNVTMKIDSVVYARVFDAKRYTYGVENPRLGLQNLAATTLRSVIGDMELDATLASRDQINMKMQDILDKATDDWGIKVTRVEIRDIAPPLEIREIMTKQMAAERERRKTVLEAKAHEEAAVSRAEGDKKAMILAAEAERDAQIARAEGRAKAIQVVYEAEAAGLKRLTEAGVSETVLRLKAMDAMKDIADGQATKVFIPTDLSDSLVSSGLVGEMLGTAKPVANGVPRQEMRKNVAKAATAARLEADPCLNEDVTAASRSAALSATKASVVSELRANKGRLVNP